MTQEDSSLYSNIIFAKNAIKDLNRFRKIIAVIIQHGFGHFVQDLNIAMIFGSTPLETEVSTNEIDTKKSPYERIKDILQELGPTFVKLGQILSTRRDLLPDELCNELQSLQNQVKSLPFDQIKKQIEQSLSLSIEELFESIDPQPLASASIAQVHIATMKGQEQVVVKVQRPDIKKQIESDLSIIKYLAYHVEKNIPEFKAFAPVAIIHEFERGILKELDFRIEARHLDKFAKNFSNWDNIIIPQTYKSHCTETVIVMERLYGVKITQAKEHYPQLDLKALAELSVAMLFKQVFEDGLFHGDLHPGNLLVHEDGSIGLIDFGLIGRLSPMMRDQLADLLMQITIQNYEGVARILYDMSAGDKELNYEDWEKDVMDLMDKHFSNPSLAEVDFGGIVKDLIDGAIKHQVQLPTEYTMFFKAVMTVEGIGKMISPDLDLLATCRPFVERLIQARYDPNRLFKDAIELVDVLAKTSKRMPKVINRLVEKIEERKFAIQIEDQSMKNKQLFEQRLSNRRLLFQLATVMLCFAIYLTHKSELSSFLAFIDKFLYVFSFYIYAKIFWKSYWEGF